MAEGTVCRALDSDARLEVTCEAPYLRSERLNSLNRRIDPTDSGKSRCHKIVALTVYKDAEVKKLTAQGCGPLFTGEGHKS